MDAPFEQWVDYGCPIKPDTQFSFDQLEQPAACLDEEIKESEGKVITFIDEMHLIALGLVKAFKFCWAEK